MVARRPGVLATTKVLVADDDPHVRSIVRRILENAGYQVNLCEDGDTAFAMLRSNAPDVLVTDLHMPGLDGFSLLNVVRSLPTPPRMVLFSGDAGQTLLEAGKMVGAQATLRKPFSMAELLAAVSGVPATP